MGSPSLVEVKIAALLHDPPWKVWVFAPRPRGPFLSETREVRDKYRFKAHEADAYALAERVGFGELLKRGEVLNIVRICDRVAATFDRHLLPEDLNPRIEGVRLLNIFDPRISLELWPPSEICINKFVNELRELLDRILKHDLRLAYHVLWYAYEPLWCIACGARTTSPADSRVPTHTVFDHNYATAMVSNIVKPGGGDEVIFDGYLVVIDFASVQRFITQSRKLRDLWASSWIASLLTWLSIQPFVECLGPDVVVMPSLRGNWFYTSWLISKLRDYDPELANKLLELARNVYRYPGWPKHPIMPTRVILAIPRIDPTDILLCRNGCEDLCKALNQGSEAVRSFIEKHIVKTWERGIEYAIRILETLIEVCGKILDIHPNRVEVLKQITKKIASRPPLPLRVIVIDISKVFSNYVEWLREKGLRVEDRYITFDSGDRLGIWALFFHYLMSELIPSLEALHKLSPTDPHVDDVWRELGSEIVKLKFCTVCGERIAVIYVPREKYDQFYAELNKLRETEGHSKYIIKGVIGEGERLCPVCALKRMISFAYDELLKRLELVKEGIPSENRVAMLSTVDIANLDKILGDWARYVGNIINSIKKSSREVGLRDRDLLEKLGRVVKGVRRFDISNLVQLRELYGYAKSVCSNAFPESIGECVEIFEYLLGVLIETAIDIELRKEFIEEMRRQGLPTNIIIEIEENIKKVRKELLTRYAIIRGDGDRIGSNVLRGALEFTPREYLRTVIGNVWESRSISELADHVNRWLRLYEDVCNKLCNKLPTRLAISIPLTPSYYYSVSRALSICAIRDAIIIEEMFRGCVVYAGGDDLLAVAPLRVVGEGDESGNNVLRLVGATRVNYWGEPGFGIESIARGFFLGVEPRNEGQKLLSPAIRRFGRTYSVVVAHYRDPLFIALDESRILEEYAKECVVTRDVTTNREFRRDKLVVKDLREGSAESIPLTLYETHNFDTLRVAIEINRLFSSKAIPSGLPYALKELYESEILNLIERNRVNEAANREFRRDKLILRMLQYAISRSGTAESVVKQLMNMLFRFGTFVNVERDRRVPLSLSMIYLAFTMFKASRR